MKSQIEYYKSKLSYEMDAADVYQAIKKQRKIQLVDTRKRAAYEVEHIANAIHLYHLEMNAGTVEFWDNDTVYVCYCDGIGCNASTKGALQLAELGFQVKELIGGIDWWKRDGLPTSKNSIETSKGSCLC